MRTLKERGMARELLPFKRRLEKSALLERISVEDYRFINEHLREIMTRVEEMKEVGHLGGKETAGNHHD